jgi:predicted permease
LRSVQKDMSLPGNLRYSARQLRNHPSFTLTVIATLALCIGANTAVFTVVDTLFFRPPPYPDAARLAVLTTTQRQGGASETNDSQTGRQWELARDHVPALEVACYGALGGLNLVAGDRAEYVGNERVSANFFHVLGVPLALGREFTRAEDVPGGPPMAILSNALWQRVFHSDPGVLGGIIELGGRPYTVVGVAPQGFVPPAHAITPDQSGVDVWTPLRATVNGEGSGNNYAILARLRPGVSYAEANAQLNSAMLGLFDEAKRAGVFSHEEATPLQTDATSEVRRTAELLWTAVGVVLLIGCINVAGLLLARASSRAREVATRQALGASRRAIVGELLSESLLLACGGGVLGIILGKYALQALVALNPQAFEIWGAITLDARVVGIMLLVSVLTSLLFGLVPALQTTRVDLRSSLAEAGRNTAGTTRQWKRKSLVFVEVALGVVLVLSAALLIRTFAVLSGADPGFDPHNVMVASASLQDERYRTSAAGTRLFRESIERIKEIPGVTAAAVASTPPYGRALNDCLSAINGIPLSEFCLTNVTYGTPGMFETLGMKLLEGRFFTDADTATNTAVAVVNRAFVRRYIKRGEDPVGTMITMEGKDRRVVGIVGDVQQKNGWGNRWGPIDTFAMVYVPAAQVPDGLFAMTNVWFPPVWIVRTQAHVAALPDAMRRALASVDPRLPFSSFRSMEQVAGRSLEEQRYRATLFSVLAGLATLLSAIGVYGLIAESVAQRTREMGIRVALGASVTGVIRAAAAPGILLSAGGVLAGLVLAWFAVRLLRSLVWGVKPTDPSTFAVVAAILIVVAIVASVTPALRLARIDPAQTLRDE